MGIRNYVLGSCVGLLARGLDLILWELEAERPLVSELEGEGEGDSVQAGPVPGRARVGVCRNRTQILLFFFLGFWEILSPGSVFCVCLRMVDDYLTRSNTCTYIVRQVKFPRCSSSRAPSGWHQLHPDPHPSEKRKNPLQLFDVMIQTLVAVCQRVTTWVILRLFFSTNEMNCM